MYSFRDFERERKNVEYAKDARRLTNSSDKEFASSEQNIDSSDDSEVFCPRSIG